MKKNKWRREFEKLLFDYSSSGYKYSGIFKASKKFKWQQQFTAKSKYKPIVQLMSYCDIISQFFFNSEIWIDMHFDWHLNKFECKYLNKTFAFLSSKSENKCYICLFFLEEYLGKKYLDKITFNKAESYGLLWKKHFSF